MKFRGIGRFLLACAATGATVLGMAACGAGTNGYLWVLASKSAANGSVDGITGFKIDNNSGNLTEIVHSPFPVGSNPVMAVVNPGGRYVFVVNTGDANFTGSGVSVFSVGGDGVLTPQQTYQTPGATPVWLDINGGNLYVLDRAQPLLPGAKAPVACPSLTDAKNTLPCGDITVFAIDSSTGRLTLQSNQSVKLSDGSSPYYSTVGPAPTRMKVVNSTSVLTVNSDNTITSLAAAGNQLTTTPNSTQIIDQGGTGNPTQVTSITTGGSYTYLTDGANNRVLQYTVTGGVLQPVTGGRIDNAALAPNSTPVWTFTDFNSRFLYVLNQSNSATNVPNSSISGYQLNANGAPTAISGVGINPAAVGANPVCMVTDPSHQYVYTSNQDGTVTGFVIDQTRGDLTVLKRNSSFAVSGRPSCLIVSGVTS